MRISQFDSRRSLVAKEKVFILAAASVSLALLLAGCGGGGGASSSTPPVTKTTPTLTWATPASVVVGTALSATQLDATASVPGSFVYSPASGTVMNTVGANTLSVSFTPTDTTDYNTASGSVTLTVTASTKTTPTITWATPASVVVGTALSATQLDATASVAGSFVYSPASGSVMNTVGANTLSVTFTPTDTTDYNTATDSVTLTVTSGPPPSYSWNNVKIIGGGYVSGLYFHPKVQNLMYARTDMGGAYRWGPNDTQWVPLFDWLGSTQSNYGGAEAMGFDPTDPNRLYVAVGEYDQSWGGTGAMMVSDDQGATFTTVPLSFKNGSNTDGRNTGERIAVDPNTPATVYFGTRIAGLQMSTDHGATWNQVTGLPFTSTANGNGVVSVLPVSSGGATKAVYVAMAGIGKGTDPVGFYVSTNPGSVTSSFVPVTGQPSFATAATPLAPLHAVIGPNGHIYVLYGDGTGPNGISTSQLWEFTPGSNWTSGTWAQIAIPVNPTGNGNGDGFGGIAVDPSNAGTLVLSTIDQWYPGDTIYRSKNDGATWTDVSRLGGTHDASLSPYIAWGGSVSNTGSGNWAGSIVIDPFNSDHVMYGTGATIWQSTDLTTADGGNNVNWTIGANGLEENAVGFTIAPPSGNTILLSSMGDIYGFAHTDLTKSPVQGFFTNPSYQPSSMDFEQNTPTTVVRVTDGTYGATPMGDISTDGGMTWTGFATVPAGTKTGGGEVAIAPDGSSIVWATSDTSSVWVSTNNGASWTAASGLPKQAQVVSDRVKAGVFYGLASNTLYISNDGGKSWSTMQTAVPGGTLTILPDAQADLWMVSGVGLYRNTGTAAAPSLTAISATIYPTYMGFGKAAPGSNYLTLYVYGSVSGGVAGFYRSIDDGKTWIQINDAAHQWGGGVDGVTGDMRTFGTVYIATGGRGIIWGTSAN